MNPTSFAVYAHKNAGSETLSLVSVEYGASVHAFADGFGKGVEQLQTYRIVGDTVPTEITPGDEPDALENVGVGL